MENLFQSKAMVGLQKFGQNLGSNKFLSALQAAMMGLMGVIMIGAISQIVCAVGNESMLGLFSSDSKLYSMIFLPYQFTMNTLSLWVVGLFAYNYAKKLKLKSPVMNAIDALVCFLLVAGILATTESGGTAIDMTYLGAQGMFVGFIVVFISVRIEKLCADKDVRIKMPDAVPPFLQDGFSSILPLLFTVVLLQVIAFAIDAGTAGAYNVPSGFMMVLGIPLKALITVPGMFVLCVFASILWCFGIHGTMIVVPITLPLWIQAISSNAAAAAAGEPLVFYPVLLMAGLSSAGGTGNTLALALMGLRSKSKQISAVAKISVLPGWFGINEPLTFGMPIMYNPILCIPYVLNIPLVMLCYYVAFQTGFIQPGWILILAMLPIGFGSYLSTLRWQNAVMDYLMVVVSGIVWYPFFKIYEKQLIAKEAAAEAEEQAFNASEAEMA